MYLSAFIQFIFHSFCISLTSNYFGFHNHAHPYVSAVVSNGTVHYDHDKDGTHSELAGREAQFRNKDYETFIMIRYENNKLSGK